MKMRYGFSGRNGRNASTVYKPKRERGFLVARLIYDYRDELINLPVYSQSDPNAETFYMIRGINKILGFRVWEASPYFDTSKVLYLPPSARINILNFKTALSRGYYRKWLKEKGINPDTLVDPTEPVFPTF